MCPRSTFVISPRGQRCGGALFVICTADLNGRGHSLITSFLHPHGNGGCNNLDASEREKGETLSIDASSLDSLGFACLIIFPLSFH